MHPPVKPVAVAMTQDLNSVKIFRDQTRDKMSCKNCNTKMCFGKYFFNLYKMDSNIACLLLDSSDAKNTSSNGRNIIATPIFVEMTRGAPSASSYTGELYANNAKTLP